MTFIRNPAGRDGQALDRRAELREDVSSLEREWQRPQAHVLIVAPDGTFSSEPFGHPTEGRGPFDAKQHLWLGYVGDTPWFAARGEDGVPERASGREPLTMPRSEIARTALALLNWHDTAPACERCGAATTMSPGGFTRRCTSCGATLFPRQDPAVIMAVLDAADRLLLAHQRVWPTGRVSILAGFVEAGEALEDAVAREVAEELGLRVTAVHYLGSQPWPFPRSLMLGFVARAVGELHVDGDEIAWARWFTPDALDAALATGEITRPPLGSIAGRIIATWRAGSLPAPETSFVLDPLPAT